MTLKFYFFNYISLAMDMYIAHESLPLINAFVYETNPPLILGKAMRRSRW